LTLRAADAAWKRVVDSELLSLVAASSPAEERRGAAFKSYAPAPAADWPQAAAVALGRALRTLPRLQSVDLRGLPGARPVQQGALLRLLKDLPAGVDTVYLPRTEFADADELAALRVSLRGVREWACEVAGRVLCHRAGEPGLAPGLMLLAGPHMHPPFDTAAVLLLGHVGPGDWFGITVNGPVMRRRAAVAGAPKVRRGGPVAGDAEFWALAPGPAGPARGAVPGTGNCVGDGWEAFGVQEPDSSLPATTFFRGEASWCAGQLEEEVQYGDWRIVCCSSGLLVGDAAVPREQLYAHLMRSMEKRKRSMLGPLDLALPSTR